jgi:hypothetical protein
VRVKSGTSQFRSLLTPILPRVCVSADSPDISHDLSAMLPIRITAEGVSGSRLYLDLARHRRPALAGWFPAGKGGGHFLAAAGMA